MALGGSTAGHSRIASIQLLRFVSAFIVVLAHDAYGFADHIGAGLGLAAAWPLTRHVGHTAVALFFMISGYIMVVASAGLFGRADGSRVFLMRRVVRIMPPYWLACVLLLAIFAVKGTAVDPGELLRSLALLPYWSPGAVIPQPLLFVGWTLFCEMVFYGLFGLGVARGRVVALLGASGGLVLLVLAGTIWQPQGAIGFLLTSPVLLLFIPGMALAWWRKGGGNLPAGLRLALLVAGLAMLSVSWPAPDPLLAFPYLAWAGLPALAVFVAAAGGDWRVPAARWVDVAGSISFALYLLHVPLAHWWAWAWPGALNPLGPWGYLAGLVAGTLVASVLFWRWVEVPMTQWLNDRLGLS